MDSNVITLPSVPDTAIISPLTELKIGGRTLYLRLTCLLLINVVERNGRSVFSAENWDAMETDDIVELLFQSTRHMADAKEITREWLTLSLKSSAMTAVGEAFVSAWLSANVGGDEKPVRPFRLKGEMRSTL
jgi:hypothetical protein